MILKKIAEEEDEEENEDQYESWSEFAHKANVFVF
jgi:hypothetical protein